VIVTLVTAAGRKRLNSACDRRDRERKRLVILSRASSRLDSPVISDTLRILL